MYCLATRRIHSQLLFAYDVSLKNLYLRFVLPEVTMLRGKARVGQRPLKWINAQASYVPFSHVLWRGIAHCIDLAGAGWVLGQPLQDQILHR